jgi:nicotinate-nucleotide adenylyltransferase
MAGVKKNLGSMRLGVFGGTFDPPHIGHMILASEAHFQLNLDRVLWVLTPEPPHKREREVTSLDRRLALLNAALGDDPAFELSRVDIDRRAPHFAADTVGLLKTQYPDSSLVYLMGSDSLVELPTWHTPQAFVEQVNEIGIMRRPGWDPDLEKLELLIPTISPKYRFIDVPQIEISSTHLRSAIREGMPFRYYLPGPVFDLIEDWGLYREWIKPVARLE